MDVWADGEDHCDHRNRNSDERGPAEEKTDQNWSAMSFVICTQGTLLLNMCGSTQLYLI